MIFELLSSEGQSLLVWNGPFFDLHLLLDVVNRVGLLHIQCDRFARRFHEYRESRCARTECTTVFGTGHKSILSQRSHVGISHLTTRCTHGVMSTSDEQVKREMWTQRVQVSALSKTCLSCILAVSRVGLSSKLETSSLRSLSIAPFLANVRLLISEMILSLPVLTKSERTCL